MKKKQEKKENYRKLRAFCSTFMLTVCFLLLGAGFLIADYNTRRVGFGEESLRMDRVSNDTRALYSLFGREKAVSVSEDVRKWAGYVWTVTPVDWRVEVWLVEAEREATPFLMDKVL